VFGPGAEVSVLPVDPIVRRFVRAGRLTVIPARRSKRRRVLDWLAQEFEPGRVYPEAAVNKMLIRFHPDFAALRRYLVDEGFMERRQGFYWRAGGTFDV
jgi:hypothetical protein